MCAHERGKTTLHMEVIATPYTYTHNIVLDVQATGRFPPTVSIGLVYTEYSPRSWGFLLAPAARPAPICRWWVSWTGKACPGLPLSAWRWWRRCCPAACWMQRLAGRPRSTVSASILSHKSYFPGDRHGVKTNLAHVRVANRLESLLNLADLCRINVSSDPSTS